MIGNEAPLRLDAPREEVLEHAVKLVAEAWQSFDRYRPEEPPLDEPVRGSRRPSSRPAPPPLTRRSTTPPGSSRVDRAAPAPIFRRRRFERTRIGTIADLLAHTYDINLAVDARAATLVEKQAVRWAAEFIGYASDAAGAFTSGGTVSNTTALAAAREHALPGSRYDGLGGKRVAIYCSQEVHYSVTRAVETLGVGSANLRAIPLGPERGLVPEALADAIDRDLAEGVTPIAVVASAGTTLTGAIDPLAAIADICEERGVSFTSTAPTGCRLSPLDPSSSSGSTRELRLVDAQSGSTCRRRAGSCWCASRRPSSRRSGTSRGTCLTSGTSCTRWRRRSSTRDPSVRSSSGSRCGCTGRRRSPRRSNATWGRPGSCTERSRPGTTSRCSRRQSCRSWPSVTRRPGWGWGSHNHRLAQEIQADGRVWMSSALVDDEVWLRPCFVNFRTTEEDVLDVVEIAAELGERLVRG